MFSIPFFLLVNILFFVILQTKYEHDITYSIKYNIQGYRGSLEIISKDIYI